MAKKNTLKKENKGGKKKRLAKPKAKPSIKAKETKPTLSTKKPEKKQETKPNKKQKTHHNGPYLVSLIILLTAAAFLKLFIKHSMNFNMVIAGYKVGISFDPTSQIFYFVIGTIALLLLLLWFLSSNKSKTQKKEEPKKEEKPKPVEKAEEKKAEVKKEASKVIKKQKSPGAIYSNLFIFSLILFFAALYLKNTPTMLLALVLMSLSLFGYKQLRASGMLKKPEPEKTEKKEQKPEKSKEQKLTRAFDLFTKLFKVGRKKEEEKKPTTQQIKLPKMELGKYETYFDALYKIIEKKGRVKISIIAKYFGVDRKKIEEWATILEEHELLKLHYPAFGEPELVKADIDLNEASAEVKLWEQKR